MDRRGRARVHRRPPRRDPADRGEGHRRNGGAWRSGVYSRRSPLPTPVRGPGSPHRRSRIGDRMTALYIPRPIETVEQVEALPTGAVLHRTRGSWPTGLVGMVLRSPYTDRPYCRVGVDHWPARRVVDTFAEALEIGRASCRERVYELEASGAVT